MYSRIVPDVAAKYGLAVARIGAVQKGYRNESYPLELTDGTTVNLLFYKREPSILDRIMTADSVASHAAARGLPVRVCADERLLKIGDSYAGLYHYLPGKTISWEAYTKRHIKLVGWAMADLHHALQPMPMGGPLLADELAGQINRMQHYFASTDVRTAMIDKLGVVVEMANLDYYAKLVEKMRHLDGQQYVHMDMVRGNILFDDQADTPWQIDAIRLSGVIDFEKASWGLPVCDIARTLAFLLVDCPKPSDKIHHYFIDSGYRKRGGGHINHLELLPSLIRLFLTYDFYKFLRHTPYESLRHNYHYSRTSDILKTYGIISPSS